MARAAVDVREAGAADVDVLMGLYASARFGGERLRAADEVVRERLRNALAAGEVRVLLASTGEVPVGYALLTTGPLLPLEHGGGPSLEHLHVVPGARRRGVGRALLRRTALLAQAEGAEQLACSVLPGDRDYTRYVARFGFTPVVVRRSVPLAVLRRRLADGEGGAGAHTTDVVARRRSLRARLGRGVPPARAAHPGGPGGVVPGAERPVPSAS